MRNVMRAAVADLDGRLRSEPGGEVVDHHGDPNPRAPDTRPAVADGGIGADVLTP